MWTCPFGQMGHWSWLIWLALLGIVIWLVARARPTHEDEKPLEILKRRYARGELSREEYARMKQDLESS